MRNDKTLRSALVELIPPRHDHKGPLTIHSNSWQKESDRFRCVGNKDFPRGIDWGKKKDPGGSKSRKQPQRYSLPAFPRSRRQRLCRSSGSPHTADSFPSAQNGQWIYVPAAYQDSQQRDCSGFAPDSLLIITAPPHREQNGSEQSLGKGMK